MDQKKTGRFLKQLRNEKKMTQEQLAAKFNVSNRSVSRWETGSNLPDISLLVEIADFYDVDVREIIDGERRSGMTDKELREVAGKMADYSDSEKKKRFEWIQAAGVLGTVISLLPLVLQGMSYEPDIRRAAGLAASFVTLLIMSVITLYVTGLLKKITSHKKLMTTVKIVTIVLLAAGVCYCIMGLLAVGLFALSAASAKITVSEDISDYNTYIHNSDPAGEYSYGNMKEFDVFPDTLDGLNVTEYSVTYYNPWDPQYVAYMTVRYDGESYGQETARLRSIGVEQSYTDYYSVTGEPDGYDLIAMDCDDYMGFVYAMVPEGDGGTEITYVAVWFCNYALDLDVHEYIPDAYLLPGFDATDENPYRMQMMGK